jgi:hypothetical protein
LDNDIIKQDWRFIIKGGLNQDKVFRVVLMDPIMIRKFRSIDSTRDVWMILHASP